jgi:uncharacterized protein YbjT (DUF2867 family)
VLFPTGTSNIESVQADINDDASILAAVRDAVAVVNAVSLYVERGSDTFLSVHVEAAERLARLARQSDVERIAHLSGIGSDPQSTSSYIRSRGEGEEAVRRAFPGATMIRPAVMFGPGDAFIAPLLKMLRVPSDFSDVRARANQAAARLCGRRGGGDRAGLALAERGFGLRAGRAAHLPL